MTWEQTIEYIRNKPSYSDLVRDSYLLSDLESNVQNYRNSQEFLAILGKIRTLPKHIKKILDVGSGNGITCISLALEGYHVTTVEPNPSDTVGCGAIMFLKQKYQLSNIDIYQGFCEDISFPDHSFDLVFARQCMHHANNLNKFVAEMGRVLRGDGYFFTVRDHVIFNSTDKEAFLDTHPLHKYYGGENAFTPTQYRNAINQAGLTLIEEIQYYTSEINYFPRTKDDIKNMHQIRIDRIKASLKPRFRFPIFIELALKIYCLKNNISRTDTYNEKKVSGRMYSYLAKK